LTPYIPLNGCPTCGVVAYSNISMEMTRMEVPLVGSMTVGYGGYPGPSGSTINITLHGHIEGTVPGWGISPGNIIYESWL
jgi:hypothetical protein